jgi:ferredoxin
MKTQIYYFTGTGNSLVVAKDIAKELNAELISIPSVIESETVKTDAQVIGIVCPVYMWGPPIIVERFIKRIERIEDKYIFAIVTCGGMAAGAINVLDREIQSCGGKLAGGFKVVMPGNYTPMYGAIAEEKQQRMFEKWNSRIKSITEYVNERKQGTKEISNRFINYLFSELIYKSGSSRIHEMDKGFWADEKCNQCGICEKVCPVNNIEVAGKPHWKGKCEQCYACLQWCPKESIQMGKNTINKKRYRNPRVKIEEIMSQARGE